MVQSARARTKIAGGILEIAHEKSPISPIKKKKKKKKKKK